MGKYAPLADFLKARPTRETPMTFAEIEQVLGFPLPPKAQNYPAWWSNNPSNNTMTKVWLAAGFRTERVDVTGRRLVFVRAGTTVGEDSGRAPYPFGRTAPKPHVKVHPAFGAMKGMIRPALGVDPTAPADPEWADLTDAKTLPKSTQR